MRPLIIGFWPYLRSSYLEPIVPHRAASMKTVTVIFGTLERHNFGYLEALFLKT
jgi:hypothetical protein